MGARRGGRVGRRFPGGGDGRREVENLPGWPPRRELGRLWLVERHYLPGCAAAGSVRELLQVVAAAALRARRPSRGPVERRRRRKRASRARHIHPYREGTDTHPRGDPFLLILGATILPGAVAQLVEASVSKTEGPRFESWLPRSHRGSSTWSKWGVTRGRCRLVRKRGPPIGFRSHRETGGPVECQASRPSMAPSTSRS
jgi:hypothetical protein